MFALWIYAVPVVTRFMFQTNASDSAAYRNGLFYVSIGFAFYSLLGTSLSFLLPRLIERFGNGALHGSALLIGAIGISSFSIITEPTWLFPAFAAIGIAWGSIGNIPYLVIGNAAPPQRMAHFMRLFAFSTAIPQAIATFALAFAVDHWFAEATNRVMALGGGSMAFAAFLAFIFKKRLN